MSKTGVFEMLFHLAADAFFGCLLRFTPLLQLKVLFKNFKLYDLKKQLVIELVEFVNFKENRYNVYARKFVNR